jgi:hypothetical protein
MDGACASRHRHQASRIRHADDLHVGRPRLGRTHHPSRPRGLRTALAVIRAFPVGWPAHAQARSDGRAGAYAATGSDAGAAARPDAYAATHAGAAAGPDAYAATHAGAAAGPDAYAATHAYAATRPDAEADVSSKWQPARLSADSPARDTTRNPARRANAHARTHTRRW